jgi:ribosomal protein S18 acetylase RimI-like enzyme
MYHFIPSVPPVDDFLRLREVSGLSHRPREAAERALPNSLYGVHVKTAGQIAGMGRVVGDGALNFEIVDIAVDPAHQGRGLGRGIMEHIMGYLDEHAPKGALISMMADVPALYEKFGFQLMRPKSEGMYMVKE